MRARTTLTALALLGTLTLTACGADPQSPPAHTARLKKAAGIGSTDLVLTKGLWKNTRPWALRNHKTRPADGDRGNRGLIRITLVGTELVALGRVRPIMWQKQMDTAVLRVC